MRLSSAIWPRPQVGVQAVAVAALLLLAWAEMAFANASSRGTYDQTGVTVLVMTLGTVFVVLGAFTAARVYPGSSPGVVWRVGVGATLTTTLIFSAIDPPGIYRGHHWALLLSWICAGVLSSLLVMITFASPRIARRLLLGAAGAYTLGVVAIVAIGFLPRIDVFILSSQAVHRTFSGENIYTACWTNNSDPLTTCVFPYMPGSALLEAPAEFILGDIRYGLATFVLLGAFAAYRLGGAQCGPFFAMLLLAQPRGLFLIEYSWTEPLLIGLMGMFLLAVVRGKPRSAILLLALALFTKQHILLLLPMTARWSDFGLRRTLLSTLLAVGATIPWFVANPGGFLHDALWFNLRLKPRSDSLSLFTVGLHHEWTPPFVLVGGLTVAAIVFAVRWLPRDASGFAVGSVLILTIFSIANKQTFFNEWSLVLAMIAFAGAVVTGPFGVTQRSLEDETAVDQEPSGRADGEDHAECRDVGP
jgi:hypothetical protein